jgi:hypothetical protein
MPKWLEPYQFQPGTTGNPNGRPKGRSITARIRELLERDEINGIPIENGKQVADLIAEAVVARAASGDLAFVNLVLDRTEGDSASTSPTTITDTTADVMIKAGLASQGVDNGPES